MNKATSTLHDPKHGLRGFLLLDAAVRLVIWADSLALTAVFSIWRRMWPAVAPSPGHWGPAWEWSAVLVWVVVIFNVFYVLHLVVLRVLIPTPKEGRYLLVPGKMPDVQLIFSALIATLTKARYEVPFPGFLVFHVANLPPTSWLMNRVFGPRSQSCYVTEPAILDPHLVTIGRNVVIGFGTTIAAHFQEREYVVIKRAVIEDDVLIGAHVAMSGVHVQRGAVIGAGSIVLPGTVVGPGEYWSGNPARRRRLRSEGAESQGGDESTEKSGFPGPDPDSAFPKDVG